MRRTRHSRPVSAARSAADTAPGNRHMRRCMEAAKPLLDEPLLQERPHMPPDSSPNNPMQTPAISPRGRARRGKSAGAVAARSWLLFVPGATAATLRSLVERSVKYGRESAYPYEKAPGAYLPTVPSLCCSRSPPPPGSAWCYLYCSMLDIHAGMGSPIVATGGKVVFGAEMAGAAFIQCSFLMVRYAKE